MYASKTPRDLNHDPLPSRNPYDGSRWRDDGGWDEMVHDPRPEFDHVQHNEPNPILVAFREYAEKHGMDADDRHNLARAWLQAERYYENRLVFPAPRDRHVDHARKVLTRLAALTEDA